MSSPNEPKRIRILMPSIGELYARLYNQAPKTCRAVWDILPIESRVSKWGDEIYFPIRIDVEPENYSEFVAKGDLGYWPPGKAFCIFFGPTPISLGGEIRAASPVNIFGHLIDDPEVFHEARKGEKIRIEHG
ncbi:MAG: cyclophilin-like family protein [Candidatus Bathyarchaeia archaeon]